MSSSKENITNTSQLNRINIKTSLEMLSGLAAQPMIQNFVLTKFQKINDCSSSPNNFMCNIFKGILNGSKLIGWNQWIFL